MKQGFQAAMGYLEGMEVGAVADALRQHQQLVVLLCGLGFSVWSLVFSV